MDANISKPHWHKKSSSTSTLSVSLLLFYAHYKCHFRDIENRSCLHKLLSHLVQSIPIHTCEKPRPMRPTQRPNARVVSRCLRVAWWAVFPSGRPGRCVDPGCPSSDPAVLSLRSAPDAPPCAGRACDAEVYQGCETHRQHYRQNGSCWELLERFGHVEQLMRSIAKLMRITDL